ncbi:MAG: DNA-directed RNA polymerase subunit omega [Candidatus Omnitrophota bacterium]|nr:DNA-directed RNA polymerase subunit omega [Candidatus Omnitrophota bacterium]
MAKEKDMSYIPMGDLLRKADSIYQLVVLVSRRAIDLSEGAERLIDVSPKAKPSSIAFEEIKKGKIAYERIENSK